MPTVYGLQLRATYTSPLFGLLMQRYKGEVYIARLLLTSPFHHPWYRAIPTSRSSHGQRMRRPCLCSPFRCASA